MTTEVFSPLSAVELTDARVPRRLLNYGGLIGSISVKLVADPAAGTKALNARQFGRWLTASVADGPRQVRRSPRRQPYPVAQPRNHAVVVQVPSL